MRQCWHNFLGISHISFITGTLLVHWWHELFQPHVNTTVKRNNSTPLPVFESSKFVRFWTEIFHDFCSNTSVKNQQWYIKLQALKLGGCQSFNPLWTVGLRNLTFYRLSQFSWRMWKIWDAKRHFAILGPRGRASFGQHRESRLLGRSPRFMDFPSFCACSESVWQIWLAENTKLILCSCSENRTRPEVQARGGDSWC